VSFISKHVELASSRINCTISLFRESWDWGGQLDDFYAVDGGGTLQWPCHWSSSYVDDGDLEDEIKALLVTSPAV
jgi:hypothetical protein